jgi:hypothetical protein
MFRHYISRQKAQLHLVDAIFQGRETMTPEAVRLCMCAYVCVGVSVCVVWYPFTTSLLVAVSGS